MTPRIEKLELDACNEFELHMPNECPKLKALTLKRCKVSNLNLELTPNLEILHIENCYCLQKIHAPVGCLKKVVRCWLKNCSIFELFSFEKWHKSAYIDSVATCKIFAKTASKCPLHPKNIPLEFECVYEEPGYSLSRYFEKIISADPCACKTFEYLLATICGLQHLRELTLRGSIPLDSICMLRHLKYLEIVDCEGIEQLPENICRLECLKELQIICCTSLRDIPNSICNMKCLKRLTISECNQVEKLPVELGCLEYLEELLLSWCTSSQEIPNSICNLKRLKRLDLSECSQVKKLPVELGCLECLEELLLRWCTSLQEIPNSICNLKRLKRLDLFECNQVEKLPEEFGCLECLEVLDIDGAGISRLPQSIYQLKGLRIDGRKEQLESYGFTSVGSVGNIRYYVFIE